MTGTGVAAAPKNGADFLQLSAASAPARGLTRWLADAVRAAIIDGRLQAGAPLPATRVLADDLGVSRGVIVEAYQRLADEGLVSARPGAGTRVLGLRPVNPGRAAGYADRASAAPCSAYVPLAAYADTGRHGCGQPSEVRSPRIVLYRFAPSSAVRASPLVVLAATAKGGSSPVTSQSTVTWHRSAMRARSREENRRVPLRDFDSLESSSPISWAKAPRLRPDASIRLRTRSGMPCMTARLAEDLRKSQNCPMMGTAAGRQARRGWFG